MSLRLVDIHFTPTVPKPARSLSLEITQEGVLKIIAIALAFIVGAMLFTVVRAPSSMARLKAESKAIFAFDRENPGVLSDDKLLSLSLAVAFENELGSAALIQELKEDAAAIR